MKLQRGFTRKEWKEISKKYKDGGVHNYRGKRTLFWNGEKLLWKTRETLLWKKADEEEGKTDQRHVYDWEEASTWEMIVIMPGVEIIPYRAFNRLRNLKVVIMADSVRRIEEDAFYECKSLELVKLSRNLEYIGEAAFLGCRLLTSIFIPPSCREIWRAAFFGCKRLIILGLPQQIQFGGLQVRRNGREVFLEATEVFQRTELIKRSPIYTMKIGDYRTPEDEEAAIQWIRSINIEDAYALHRACSSFNPLPEIIHDIVKRQGIGSMRVKNEIGITPSQYLNANPFAEISEREIVKRYILDMMGEII